MKTLHLTNAWHPTSGGVATFYRALAANAEQNRQHVRLVVPSEADGVEDLSRWARIYHLRAPRSPFDPKYRVMLPHRILVPGSVGHRILCQERPDVVEVCDKYSLNYVGAMLRRGLVPGVDFRPVVVGLSCERMDVGVRSYLTRTSSAEPFVRWYMKWLYFPFFDHHITVSAHTAAELHDAAKGHVQQRGVWIRPMGVDAGLFSPQRRTAAKRAWLERQSTERPGTTLLLYAGRLAPEKNAWLLLGMIERLIEEGEPDFHLLIAGDGPLRPELERGFRERLPGQATFLGHIADREKLADLYANADIFIHPNPTEPFGIGPLEAMASGVPIVAPDTGGVTAYANLHNAWISPATAEEFANSIRQCRNNREERAARIRAARSTAEQHRWEAVTAQFAALYRELHAVVTGIKEEPELRPAFVSTSGNWLGREI